MAVLAVLFVSAGATPRAETIAIGSKAFTENRLLAEMLAQLVEEHTDLEVERRLGLGGTIFVFNALRAGEIDIYPEYTGTGWAIHLGETERVSDPLRVYLHVADEFERRFDISWLQPFGFQNSYALAVREETALELGLRTISDLVEHQDAIVAGVSHEFLERSDGFPGLAEAYGL